MRGSAERSLVEAEQKLDRLPRLVRGRRRDELRAEIARERSAIRLADEKLAQLDDDFAGARRPSSVEPARPPNGERGRQHDPPALRPREDLGLGL